jgi:hypothetical protein
MAELIPLHYRLRVAQKRHLQRWFIAGGLAVAVSLASVSHAFVWQHRQSTSERDLIAQVAEKSAALVDSQKIVLTRQDLAGKMQRVEQLMEDKMLLSLLKNVSEGFAATDCLENISIDARGKSLPVAAAAPGPDGKPVAAEPAEERYAVRLTGITANNATLSDLVTRLSRQTSPAMNVVLESSKRENMFDGQVMRFEILCEKPRATKGT